MEMGLIHDYFGNFSMRGERYYICMEGSTQGEIEMNLGNAMWERRLKHTLENSEIWKTQISIQLTLWGYPIQPRGVSPSSSWGG